MFVVPTKWDDIIDDDEKENDEETIKESEDEEEIMTLTQMDHQSSQDKKYEDWT